MRTRYKSIANICITLFFVICVIAPLLSMLCRITPEGIAQVSGSPQFLPAVRNSISTAAAATGISFLLAMLAAWRL